MEIDPKFTIKGDLLSSFFYGKKKSDGMKEPRQLSFHLVIVILSISILWPLESIWNTRIFFVQSKRKEQSRVRKTLQNSSPITIKGLFGELDSNNFSMIESFTSDILRVPKLEMTS